MIEDIILAVRAIGDSTWPNPVRHLPSRGQMKNSITRRQYAALLGGAVGMWAIALRAQPAERMRVIGVLMGLANDEEAQVRAKIIEQGLAKRGWIVGQISASNTGMPTATRNSCRHLPPSLST